MHVVVFVTSMSTALQGLLIQLVHAEDLIGEKDHCHQDDQEQGHLQLLLIKWFEVHLVFLDPDPLHGGD